MTGSALDDTLEALRPDPLRYAGYRPCRSGDDVKIFYRARGLGEPVVVINNLFQDPALWTRCGSLLTDVHRVVTFDLRNQGMSGRGAAGASRHAHDVVAVLDALGTPTASLLGHSYGTRIALECAIRFPERVDALVLCSPVVHRSGSSRRAHVMRAWRQALIEHGARRLFDIMWPLIASDAMLAMLDAGEGAAYEALRTSFAQAVDVDAVRANLEGALDDQAQPLDLSRVRCPVLLLVGEDDWLAAPGALRELCRELPTAQKTTIQRSAHLPYFDDPHAVVTAVRAFLESRAVRPRDEA